MELVLLDWMFGASVANRPQKIYNLLKKLEEVYPEMKDQSIFRKAKKYRRDKNVELRHYKYADIIYQYLLDNISQPMIIEGRHIYEYMNYKLLKGKIIIKRTSLINAYRRAFKRDASRLWKKYKNRESTKKDVLNKIHERLIFPITNYLKVNQFIITLLKEKQMK